MPKYEDCESCAFYGVEPAICDECEDADMWEPDDQMAQQSHGCPLKPRGKVHTGEIVWKKVA